MTRRTHDVRRNSAPDEGARPGAPRLTARELQVLQLIGKGYNYEHVGDALALSLNTVSTHVRHIYRKLDVNSKSEAILRAIALGLVPHPAVHNSKHATLP